MLDLIESTIDQIDPDGGVCDLFAGSGSVSLKLASKRNIVSVDVQEYSRVICSALLNPSKSKNTVQDIINESINSEHTKTLEWALEPLIIYEELCINEALKGNSDSLCDLLENGSIITREKSKKKTGLKGLNKAINESLDRIKQRNLDGPESLVIRYFGGLYFSYKQSVHLDAILHQVFKLKSNERDLYLAPILSTASNIVNTVGKQFAQPIRPRKADGTIKSTLGNSVKKDRSIDVFAEYYALAKKYVDLPKSPFSHEILKMDYSDALDVLKSNIRVVYADPPYTRDHYSRYYHVLETICLRDNPRLSTMTLKGETMISRGVYREERHQSPFCIKSQAPAAIEVLFRKVRKIGSSLVLSYSPYDESKNSHPRLLTMNQILGLAKKYFKSVEVISAGPFIHSKLTHTEKHLEASKNAEVLIVCKP